MKHKTWFRLVLKAIGILLIGQWLNEFANSIWWLLDVVISGGDLYRGYANNPYYTAPTTDYREAVRLTFEFIGPILPFVFGLYLLFGGKWLVDKIIPSNRPYCPNCGYPLTDTASEQCPECGIALPTLDAPSVTETSESQQE